MNINMTQIVKAAKVAGSFVAGVAAVVGGVAVAKKVKRDRAFTDIEIQLDEMETRLSEIGA